MNQAAAVLPPRVDRSVRVRERIDGVLLLDKPRGLSSSQAVAVARRLLGAVKAGHGGTLDPMASGLLPILFGEATKFAHDLLEADKTYVATLRFGQTSTTADAEGEIADTGGAIPDRAALAAVIACFVGSISQRPPMHSALKHHGRPLYDYARSGIEIERTPRTVVIHQIDLLGFDGERARLRVNCSKGTYIRTLAADIGSMAGCGAWLADLRRERVAALSIDRAVTLNDLEELEPGARRSLLGAPDALVQRLPRIDLSPEQAMRFAQGQRLRIASDPAAQPVRVRVYDGSRLIGVAMLEQGLLASQRLIAVASGTVDPKFSGTASPVAAPAHESPLRNQDLLR